MLFSTSASRTQWETFTDGTSTAKSATITGVNNGVFYVVRVAAESKRPGAWSAESTSVVPGNVQIKFTGSNGTGRSCC